MAQPYLNELTQMLRELRPSKPRGVNLECKHFFSGAALYANGRITASLTPAGLALKLPDSTRAELFRSRNAVRLRYFAKAPIKKEYALLLPSLVSRKNVTKRLFAESIRFTLSQGG